jgi:hypothetical protein
MKNPFLGDEMFDMCEKSSTFVNSINLINNFIPMKNQCLITRIIVCTALALLTLPCAAQNKYTLAYNFAKGQNYKQTTATDMLIVQDIMGQEMKITSQITMTTDFNVRETRNNAYTLDVRYKEMKLTIDMGGAGASLALDSNTPDDKATLQNLSPMLKAVTNKPIEFVMTKSGKLESLKGIDKIYEAMLNSLDASVGEAMRQQVIGQIGNQLSDAAIKSSWEQYNYYPENPVAIGESWDGEVKIKMNDIDLVINSKTTLKSVDDKVFVVEGEGILSSPPNGTMKVNGMDISVSLKGTQKATIESDRKTGWVIRGNVVQHIEGELEAMGTIIPITLDLTALITD